MVLHFFILLTINPLARHEHSYGMMNEMCFEKRNFAVANFKDIHNRPIFKVKHHFKTYYIRKTALIINTLLVINFSTTATETTVNDSTHTRKIKEVTVTGKKQNPETRSSTPLQQLTAKQIEQLNALQISDAVKYFSGVTVKDYGGIGGLKTVSIRSLGSNHTAVSYDGISLTDCQTGQIDLGRFSLENVDMLSLSNGQSDNIFQPARQFAAAAVINIQTLKPRFEDLKTINGRLSLKGGSFGLINPSLYLEKKLSPVFASTFSGEWLSANGEYPYTVQNGTTTTVEKRRNSDVKNLRLEATLYGTFSEKENASLKTYYYQSERGLPGAVVLYNEGAINQRIWDRTFFTQGHYEKEFSKQFVVQANAKYNNGWMRYLDPTYPKADGKMDNSYLQQECYGSASVLYRHFEHLTFSASSDGSINHLNSELARPTRYSWLSVLATKYVDDHLLATASLLSTVISETVKTGDPAQNNRKVSPFVSVSYKPFSQSDFRVRAFYKNIFRMPTFNDLYYTQVGKRDLKPEDSYQYNLGLTYSLSKEKTLPHLSLTADIYHNEVTNKIVTYPNQDYFWTTINYGKVQIDGIDVAAEAAIRANQKVNIILGTNYTYQRALNVTDPTQASYKNQIPYTPRVSGSGKAAIETPWFNAAYTLLWSGKRYAVNENYAENRLSPYTDHSFSVYRTFPLKKCLLNLNIEVLNLLNENYEIVKWYPMPGRSFRTTISLKF